MENYIKPDYSYGFNFERSQEINDALDILSSCYHEYDLESANFGTTNWDALRTLDHAMAYLEKTYSFSVMGSLHQ